ncbi:hypothetical protein BHM03_00017916 [Ensete ventricosum]|nr:hypothetical protein BHM03_00017916 [Ensete ventricosum]
MPIVGSRLSRVESKLSPPWIPPESCGNEKLFSLRDPTDRISIFPPWEFHFQARISCVLPLITFPYVFISVPLETGTSIMLRGNSDDNTRDERRIGQRNVVGDDGDARSSNGATDDCCRCRQQGGERQQRQSTTAESTTVEEGSGKQGKQRMRETTTTGPILLDH